MCVNILFILLYKMALTLKSVDDTLECDYSNKNC